MVVIERVDLIEATPVSWLRFYNRITIHGVNSNGNDVKVQINSCPYVISRLGEIANKAIKEMQHHLDGL